MTVPFPDGRRFAFTVFDDTDGATLANVKPVYDLLYDLGFRTTKSTWVYPPRGSGRGACLQDEDYLTWLLELQSRGFELGLHNVGDGRFSREEILRGFEVFREKLGRYPACHTNHMDNDDNIYWFKDRFEWPVNHLYNAFYRLANRCYPISAGSDPASERYWGDTAKAHLQYIRNLTFNGINTLRSDPRMPYRVRRKSACSNLWFSSSDGHAVPEMNELMKPEHVDVLEAEGGACIAYTHFAFGFVGADGRLDPVFRRQMEYLAKKPGWYVPVTPLLDHLAAGHTTEDPGYAYRLGRNLLWLKDRFRKRVHHGR